MEVTFWLNMPSHHMTPVLKSFHENWDDSVSAIFMQSISEQRKNLGWQKAELGSLSYEELHGDITRLDTIAKSRTGLNIFGGVSESLLKRAWSLVSLNPDASCGLIAEAGIPLGLKGRFRPLFHRVQALKTRESIAFVLAMGQQGVEYYARAGYEPKKIYPFMYQCEGNSVTSMHDVHEPVKLVYVGSFSKRKGFDLLLHSLALQTNRNWRLTVIGGGDGEQQAKLLAESLGLVQLIDWVGPITSDQVPQILSQQDVCIVPSRFDGWGMAVNESIEAGLAVICTSKVGSKDLVSENGTGLVCEEASVMSLSISIERMLNDRDRIISAKAASRRIRSSIRGDSVAAYLSKVIKFSFGDTEERPLAPWLSVSTARGKKETDS